MSETVEMEAKKTDLETKIGNFLDDGDVISAIKEVQKEENKTWISEHGWDKLIPVVAVQINSDNWRQFPQIVTGCEELLCHLAGCGKPKETLIALAEHCEAFSDDIKYRHILPAIAVAFEAWDLSMAASKAWGWMLELLIGHLHASTIPDIPVLEGKERLMLDSDQDISELCQNVQAFVSLVQRLAIMISKCPDVDGGAALCRGHLAQAVVKVLARPLAYLPMDDNLPSSASASESQSLALCLLVTLKKIAPNPVHLLSVQSMINYFGLEPPKERDYNAGTEIRWSRGVGTLFYLILDSPDDRGYVPAAYSPSHLFDQLIGNVNLMLLDDENYLLHLKALALIGHLMAPLPKASLHAEQLDSGTHLEFLRALYKAIVYHSSQEIRRLAFNHFQTYFNLYTLRARYRLSTTILRVVNHSGLIGYTIGRVKDLVLDGLHGKADLPDEFCGRSLHALVNLFGSLKHGEETDLLEVNDEIMASLNFLIGVLMCDTQNRTQLRDLLPELQAGFLQQLQRGIQLSLANYRARLSEDEAPEECTETTVTVGGRVLPVLNLEQKKQIMASAINALDMMSCVLAKLNEVIDQSKKSRMNSMIEDGQT